MPMLRVHDAARQLGCSAAWLRVLERTGRIPPAQRDVNGHRRYTEQDIARLRALLLTPSGVAPHAEASAQAEPV